MAIHSKFVVHWTGNDFHKRNTAITTSIREQYVERLRDDCVNGLFMKPGQETIHGSNGSDLTASISRVCFTEVRLSQVEDHARLYGMLGIGFHRDFVLSREGNPVLYVQNGDKGVLIENLAKVREFLEAENTAMLKNLEVVLGYLKNMSHQNVSELGFYEEMEWRVVHLERLMTKYIKAEDVSQHIYRLLVKLGDIKIIVFPDHETKNMAIADPDIRKFFNQCSPMMTTVEDCSNF
jgi:hypothetical protein